MVDAARIEPVSAVEFPANREINREFRRFRPSAAILASNRSCDSMACRQIPYANEQGMFGGITGNFFQRTGNSRAGAGNSTSDQFFGPTTSFTSLEQLQQHINAFIHAYNDKAEPFVWTKKKIHQRRFKGRRITQL